VGHLPNLLILCRDFEMNEYINVRASETLGQGELVSFLKENFPSSVKRVGKCAFQGTESVEVLLPKESPGVEKIREFISTRRSKGEPAYTDFKIGWPIRKYKKSELLEAEVLRLVISAHFEPCGEQCGTIYDTVCTHCNLGHQLSDLVLDLGKIPQNRTFSETISWVEWVTSTSFATLFKEQGLKGAKFAPIFDFKEPSRKSEDWTQLLVIGEAGRLTEQTRFGKDPFSSSEAIWKCPLGHSIVAEFLSEIYLKRSSWRGDDIAVTINRFGQGRNLLRPTPLILISQRMFRLILETESKGFAVEIAHLE
jgi:hypothetical protein